MAEILGFIAVATGVGIYASRSRSRGGSKSDPDETPEPAPQPKPAPSAPVRTPAPTANQIANQAKRNEAARIAKITAEQKRMRKLLRRQIKMDKKRAKQQAKETQTQSNTYSTPPSTPAESPYVTPSNKTDPKFDTFYNTLGVSKNATQAEIKKAFKRKAMPIRPNVQKEGNNAAKGEYEKLLRAYKILTDPKERANYERRRGLRVKNTKRIENDPERKSTLALDTMSKWPLIGSIIEKDPRLRRIIAEVVDSVDTTYKRTMLENLKTALNRARNNERVLRGILYAFAAISSLMVAWYMIVRGGPKAIEWSRDFAYSANIVIQNTQAQTRVVLNESVRRLTVRYSSVTKVPLTLLKASKKSLLNAGTATRGAMTASTQTMGTVYRNVGQTTRRLLGKVAKEVMNGAGNSGQGNVGTWWNYLFSAALASATVPDLRKRMVPFILLWLTFMVLMFGILSRDVIPVGDQLQWTASGNRPTHELFRLSLNSSNVPAF